MKQTLEQALASTGIYSDGHDYRLLRLPPQAITLAAGIMAEGGIPFCAAIADKDEMSLLLRDDVMQEFAGRLRSADVSEQSYRQITFEAPLEPSLVGFIAEISAALAEAQIPILAFAAYSRDHIFVPQEHFDAAMQALAALQDSYL
ncbi:MAG: ACT domain-containing protein [Anaerolineae bacterium]|nr:ACT domain-containing protein [Anaerolineae bacterium]